MTGWRRSLACVGTLKAAWRWSRLWGEPLKLCMRVSHCSLVRPWASHLGCSYVPWSRAAQRMWHNSELFPQTPFVLLSLGKHLHCTSLDNAGSSTAEAWSTWISLVGWSWEVFCDRRKIEWICASALDSRRLLSTKINVNVTLQLSH